RGPSGLLRPGVHARGDAPGPARSGLRSEAQPVRTTVSDHPHALPLEGFLMETKKMETTKIRTYIDGLDEVLGGGLPAGHVVLVSGLPGTMKSTLSYSILHRNAIERGARALYVSLEQTRKSLENQMSAMGLDVEAVRGAVHILDVEAPLPRRDETFFADGILELKMHQITDVEVQRRVRVTKMRGSHHKTGFSALVFEDGRFHVTPVISL